MRVVGGLIDDSDPVAELRARYPGDDFCDASGCVMLPGFVDAHVHLYEVLAHGVHAPAAPSADLWNSWTATGGRWWRMPSTTR